MSPALISNTGPIIALAGIGHLFVLRDLYARVVVPQAVNNEIRSSQQCRTGIEEYCAANWIDVQDEGFIDPLLLTELDLGEAAVLTLAVREKHVRVLIDERKARKIARLVYGLNVIGTARILVDAKHGGLIQDVKDLIEKMRINGYWVHDSIVEYALEMAGEK